MEIIMLTMNKHYYQRYEKAKKEVKKRKSFYRHLIVYVIIMLALFFIRYVVFPSIGFQYNDENFRNWLDLNTYGLAIVWLIAIMIQGFFVFKPKSIEAWEEKKIKEILAEEESKENQKWN